jgi:1-acyl-sn-glycerol-3-phosphate acyltransferase
VRAFFSTCVLFVVRVLARTFWRVESRWVGDIPEGDRWSGIRVVAILNHTSLYEPIFAGAAPWRFMRKLARHGVVPIADVTLRRPIVGRFFRNLTAHVVAISRQRDRTWREVLAKVDDPKRIVALLPEGRMKRADGLDKDGRPMTVRAGVADILLATPDGRMLLAYSAGLHHVQVPGQHLPRLFKTVRIQFEVLDVAAYRDRLLAEHGEGGFHAAVIADLTRRRDLYCLDWTAQ